MIEHDLDYSEIDELDEISGDEQQALIWCDTHRKFEWHWAAVEDLGVRRRPSPTRHSSASTRRTEVSKVKRSVPRQFPPGYGKPSLRRTAPSAVDPVV